MATLGSHRTEPEREPAGRDTAGRSRVEAERLARRSRPAGGRSGVPRGLVPLARRGPGMARDIPAKRREGHAAAGMPVRAAARGYSAPAI